MQYAFVSPFTANRVRLFNAGDPTTGDNGFQYNLESDYTVPRGRWSGVGLYFDLVAAYESRASYVYYPSAAPNGTQVVNERRTLYGLPVDVNCNLGLHYTFRLLRRYSATSRLFLANVFNHDPLLIYPQPGNGSILQVVQRHPPRLWSWENEVRF
jgi:hypothetical protein